MSKKVLMTNLYLQKYTGSELHTLELARQFKKNGYEVTIVVYSKSYPLLAFCDDFKVIECQNEKLEEDYFDIVFIQHFPVYDYLCSHYSIRYRYLIVSKLSSFNEYETLPECYQRADLISVVSKECADTVKPYSNNLFLFQNSVESQFFESYSLPNQKELKKICIISNHVPEELYELKDVMQEYSLSYIGSKNDVKLVCPDLLQEYDLIITIGRTVQQCLACGVPVFVYDYFGGPGYLNEENIDRAQKHNFSGRGFEKMSVAKLKAEIVSGYLDNFENLEIFMKYAKKNFNLDETFKNMLSQVLQKLKPISELSQYNELDKSRFALYSELVGNTVFLNTEYCQKSQLYVDSGEGFCEERSFIWNACSGYPIEKTFYLEGVKKLRLDPANIPSKCKVNKILINGEDKTESCRPINSILSKDDLVYFTNYDPQFLIEAEGDVTITLIYSYEFLSARDQQILESVRVQNKQEMEAQINQMKNQFQRMYFKLHPIKRIMNKIKKRT